MFWQRCLYTPLGKFVRIDEFDGTIDAFDEHPCEHPGSEECDECRPRRSYLRTYE